MVRNDKITESKIEMKQSRNGNAGIRFGEWSIGNERKMNDFVFCATQSGRYAM